MVLLYLLQNFCTTVVEILNKPFVLFEKKGSSICYFTETIFFCHFQKSNDLNIARTPRDKNGWTNKEETKLYPQKKLAKWVKNSFSVGNVLYASACAFITYINDVGFFWTRVLCQKNKKWSQHHQNTHFLPYTL